LFCDGPFSGLLKKIGCNVYTRDQTACPSSRDSGVPSAARNVENASAGFDFGSCDKIFSSFDGIVRDLAEITSHPACLQVRFELREIGRR